MVIPFFGKKGANRNQKSADVVVVDQNDEKSLQQATQGFTDMGGGLGRGLTNAANKIQVSEGINDEESVIEEATILYASGNDIKARESLEKAIDIAPAKASKMLWYMLLDLYRQTGEQSSFEVRAFQFAGIFEISPPAWDSTTASAAVPVVSRTAIPVVNLSGNLTGSASAQFEQMVKVGSKIPRLRVDLSRMRGIDDDGCVALLSALRELKRAGTQVALLGAKNALALVEGHIKVGERTHQSTWLFVLALMQQQGEQEPFEDMALNYAITFEESPPSWEPPVDVGDLIETSGLLLQQDEPVPDRFVMEGVISGQAEALSELVAYAARRQVVDIEASQLKRMEFVSAGALFNLLANFQVQGKRTVIHNPNAMVAALMRVMGVDQVAQLDLKNT